MPAVGREADAGLDAQEARGEIADLGGVFGVADEIRAARESAEEVEPAAETAVEPGLADHQVLAGVGHDLFDAVIVAEPHGAPTARKLDAGFIGPHVAAALVDIQLDLEAIPQAVVRPRPGYEADLSVVDLEVFDARQVLILVVEPHLELDVTADREIRALGGGTSRHQERHSEDCRGSQKIFFHGTGASCCPRLEQPW